MGAQLQPILRKTPKTTMTKDQKEREQSNVKPINLMSEAEINERLRQLNVPSTSTQNQSLTESIRLLTEAVTQSLNIQRPTTKFEDVGRSFKKFTGISHVNFNSWEKHFEEQSLLYQLNEVEKFIFAKRLMEKDAKLFIDFESEARNWNELKSELRNEFGQKINGAIIHQRLKDRKENENETTNEYFYEMLSLAAHSDIDHAAIITYTIQGLPGSNEAKSFMYEADTIKQFKRKLQAYDLRLNDNEKYNDRTKTTRRNNKFQAE